MIKNSYSPITHARNRLIDNKPHTTSHSTAEDAEITSMMRKTVFWAVLLAGLTALLMGGMPNITLAVEARPITLPFSYDFRTNGTLDEAKDSASSWSPYWWVASGARLVISNGVGQTLAGDLPVSNKWNQYYAQANPVATDIGKHPQNVFQMFLRDQVLYPSEQVYVKEKTDNLGNSLNRKAWNGVSLLLRYVDSNNYYYAGMRADGGVVIKKKVDGVYKTLAYKKVFPGTYNTTTAPNLIPKGQWIGLKAVVTNEASGNPKIALYMDQGKTGSWQLAAEAIDDPNKYGKTITASGLVGIQSDFADVEFDDFLLNDSALNNSAAAASTTSTQVVSAESAEIAPVASIAPVSLFTDTFAQYADGLLTNEYAYWNPTNSSSVNSRVWEMTSGSLFAQGGAGWSGVPDAIGPNALSTNGNNSAVFRLTTKQADFGSVAVDFDLLNQGLSSTASTPAVDWDGVHVFLRYQSEESLYYASINRRDNTVAIKKKVPGGSSNGGTYYNISTFNTYQVPFGTWQHVKATIKDNADGSVTIELFGNGKLVARAVDNGSIGGAPIRNTGKVGIRGDNANIKFKNFTVTAF